MTDADLTLAGLRCRLHVPGGGPRPLLLYLHGIGEARDQSAHRKPEQRCDKSLDDVAWGSPIASRTPARGRFVIAAPQMETRGNWDPHIEQLGQLIAEVRARYAADVGDALVLAGFSRGGSGVVSFANSGSIAVDRWCAVDAAPEPEGWWWKQAIDAPHAIINARHGLRRGPDLPEKPEQLGASFRVHVNISHMESRDRVFDGSVEPIKGMNIYDWLDPDASDE